MSDEKPLRDWLLRRHASTAPRLDALRRAAVPPAPFTWRDLGRELFQPHRTAWTALGAVWLALVLFQVTTRRPTAPHPAAPPSPEAVAAWLAQLNSNESIAQIDRHP